MGLIDLSAPPHTDKKWMGNRKLNCDGESHLMFACHIAEPSESPTDVRVTPLNATTVVVSWTPPLPEHRNGIIQGYTIRVVGVHTPEDFTLSVNSTETMIGSLHPFYSYKYTVAAVTISHGPFSNPVTVMIPPLGMSKSILVRVLTMNYSLMLRMSDAME